MTDYKFLNILSLDLKNLLKPQEVLCAQKSNKLKQHEKVRKDLPTYSAEDVSKHSDE